MFFLKLVHPLFLQGVSFLTIFNLISSTMPDDFRNWNTINTMVYRMWDQFIKNPDSNQIIGSNLTPPLTNENIQAAASPLYYILGDGVKKITMSSSPPSSPEPGDIWIDTS